MATVDEIKIVVRAEVDAAVSKMQQLDNVNKSNTKTGVDLAKSIAGYTTGYGLAVQAAQAIIRTGVDLIKTSVQLAAAQERVKMEFAVLTGSMEVGNKLFAQMNALAAQTPLELSDIAAAGKQLLSVGIPVEEITTKLRLLGDVAMGNPEKLQRLVEAFGQLKSKGVASMEQLNRFVEAGVPIMAELQKQTGKSGDEVFKMVSQGKIGYAEITKALESLTGEGGLMHDMMKRVAETTEGKFSTALDNAKNKLIELGKNLLPVATAALDAFNNALGGTEKAVAPKKSYTQQYEDAKNEIAKSTEMVKALKDALAKSGDQPADLRAAFVRNITASLEEEKTKIQLFSLMIPALEAKAAAEKAAADALKPKVTQFVGAGYLPALESGPSSQYMLDRSAMAEDQTEALTKAYVDYGDAMLTASKIASTQFIPHLGKLIDDTRELTDAEKELQVNQQRLADLMASGLTDSIMALGEAMITGQDGWDNWAASGLKAIAQLVAEWSKAQILLGIGKLMGGDMTGFGNIAAGSGGAILSGALSGSASELANSKKQGVASRGMTYVDNRKTYVAGSVIRERDLDNAGNRAEMRRSRGY
jgi:tape measure domain-containing protein